MVILFILLCFFPYDSKAEERFRLENYHRLCPYYLRFADKSDGHFHFTGTNMTPEGERPREFRHLSSRIKLKSGKNLGDRIDRDWKCFMDWGLYCYGITLARLGGALNYKITAYTFGFLDFGVKKIEVNLDFKERVHSFHFSAGDDEFKCDYHPVNHI